MHRELLSDILNDYSDDEEKYDQYVSSCIDDAAKKGVNLSLEAATGSARNKFKTGSHQNNRLQATQALVDSKFGRFKPSLDPISLADYHFEVHDCDLMGGYDVNPDSIWHTGKNISESETALEIARSQARTHSLILVRNISVPDAPPEYFYGQVFCFRKKLLEDKFQFRKSHPLYKNYGEFLDEKEILQLKTLALDFYHYSNLFKLFLEKFMILLAEKPNNPKILRYLIQLAASREINILPIVQTCLEVAIHNQHLSNVFGILKEYKELAKNFVFNFSNLETGIMLKENDPPQTHSEQSPSNEKNSLLVKKLSILTARRDSTLRQIESGRQHSRLEKNLENLLKEISEIENTLKEHKENKADSLIKRGNQKEISLQTHSPLVDILLLLQKYKNTFLEKKLHDYFTAITDNHDEKISKKFIKKRQIISLVLLLNLSVKHKFFANRLPSPFTAFFNQFADLLHHSLVISDEKLMTEFYKNVPEMFRHADIEKIKSVIIPDIFQKPENLNLILNIFSIFKECNLSKNFSYLVGSDLNLMRDRLLALSQKKSSNSILPELISQTRNILVNTRFPISIALIVVEYMTSSFFEVASQRIQTLVQDSKAKWSIEGLCTYNYPTYQQENGAPDCGYWSLFNLFLNLSRLSDVNCFPNHSLLNHFQNFKISVSHFLNNSGKDLTAVDLEEILGRVITKKDYEFTSSFPNLYDNLNAMREEAGGIPPYTIINSVLVGGEQKLDNSFSFGGCLPLLKIQIAINFHMLSLRSTEPTFHFLIIGTRGHWHLQLLALAYQMPALLFKIDSSVQMTNQEITRQISSHILDLLKNPGQYGENVSEEVIPDIDRTLALLDKTLSSGLPLSKSQEQVAQSHCEMAAQFFSTFSKLSWAKKFFQTLRLARKVAHGLQKDYPEFVNIAQQLTYLQGLYSEDKSMNPGLFGSSVDTPISQIDSTVASFVPSLGGGSK